MDRHFHDPCLYEIFMKTGDLFTIFKKATLFVAMNQSEEKRIATKLFRKQKKKLRNGKGILHFQKLQLLPVFTFDDVSVCAINTNTIKISLNG